MTNREAPAVASWLLKKLVRGEHSEPLLGDLIEEYQTGRSPGWYWWETLAALLHALRRGGCRLFSRRVAYFIPVLTAQCLLLVWIFGLSEQHMRLCRTLSTLSRTTTVPMLSAGAAEVAIVLAIWLGRSAIDVRAGRTSWFLRLLVLVFAAVGLGSGAITWAGTAVCLTGPLSCSHSATADSCALRRDARLQGNSSAIQPARRPRHSLSDPHFEAPPVSN